MRQFRRDCNELSGAALLAAIHVGLADLSNIVCEMAAQSVVELNPGECREQLVAAWQRFMIDPQKSDKNCRAKLPIVDALNQQEYDDVEFYLRAVRHTQLEPAYGAPGGYEDTAAGVRSAAAFGLINCPLASPDETLHVLIDLLFDNEWSVRENAARALAQIGSRAATAVLKMKVRAGDVRSEVVGACLVGLVKSNREQFLDFIAGYLTGNNPDIGIEASLALGESRSTAAAERLIEAHKQARVADLRDAHLMSLGLSRVPVAIDYLIELIGGHGKHAAIQAIAALAPNRFDESTRDRVLEAVNAAKDRDLSQAFAEHF